MFWLDRDGQGLSLVVAEGKHRCLFKRIPTIAGFLPAIFGDVLGEVTLIVEEPYADEGQAEIRSFLGVVAGKDAQPTGIRGETFMQSKLSGEIGDGVIGEFGVGA